MTRGRLVGYAVCTYNESESNEQVLPALVLGVYVTRSGGGGTRGLWDDEEGNYCGKDGAKREEDRKCRDKILLALWHVF